MSAEFRVIYVCNGCGLESRPEAARDWLHLTQPQMSYCPRCKPAVHVQLAWSAPKTEKPAP